MATVTAKDQNNVLRMLFIYLFLDASFLTSFKQHS